MPSTSSKPRKFLCPTCAKKFTTSGHLSRHARIHTGERNYACPYPGCPTKCSRKDNLSQHYRVHLGPGSRASRVARQHSKQLAEKTRAKAEGCAPDAYEADAVCKEEEHVLRPPSRSSTLTPQYSSPENSPRPADPIVSTLDRPSQPPRAKQVRLEVSTSHLPSYHSTNLSSPQSPYDYAPTSFSSEPYSSAVPTSPSSSSAYSDNAVMTPEIQTAALDGYFVHEQQTKLMAWPHATTTPVFEPHPQTFHEYPITYHSGQYASSYEMASSNQEPRPPLRQPQPILWSHEQSRYTPYYDSYC
ncbi:hypothetical protein DL96DRAFT_850264 [Flagelloscypha sp. PMI_526]|nr:hypothetical protein DL96DRAFT_850264 [Flagelloscypha sp. PMI_526]